MKKKVYKIAAAIMALILMCCLCCFTVSAEEETSSFVSNKTIIMSNPSASVHSFVFHPGDSNNSGLAYLDREKFSETSADYAECVTAYEGEYNFPYHQFDVYYDFLFPSTCENVFSYAFESTYVSSVDPSAYRYQLQYVDFSFWTSLNVYCWGLRFSLREYYPAIGKIGQLVAVSEIFEYPSLSNPFSGPDYIEHCFSADFINFTRVSNLQIAEPYLVVCADFLFNSNAARTPSRIGINSSLSFEFWQLSLQSGPQEAPYYPELNDPMYRGPDNSSLDNLLSIENNLSNKFGSGKSGLSGLYSSLLDGLPSISGGLFNVAAAMTYLTSELPLFSLLITCSLVFGLFAFILGLSASLMGAAGRWSRSADPKERTQKKDSG